MDDKEKQDIDQIHEKLMGHFKDEKMVTTWLNCHNPNFGCKPILLIMAGRSHKVLQVINSLLEGY